MDNRRQTAEAHYTRPRLGETILDALRSAGKDIDALAPADLAPVDEFHIRGRRATVELARVAELRADLHVLDVGSGLGGPSRYLAAEFGCSVTGLDITAEYCRVAAMLAQRMGLDGRVDYRHGDALDMPFPDAIFDQVWMQHVAMNIADKARLYGELGRVLKPGGRLAVYEIVAGASGPPYYPTPWAREASLSFLISAADMRRGLEAAGFQATVWRDVTAVAVEWFRHLMERLPADRHPPLGPHLLLGDDWRVIGANQVKNLRERRIALVQGILERPLLPSLEKESTR